MYSLNSMICCFCSVSKSCLTLWNPMDCSTPGFPVLHYLPESVQIHIHRVDDAILPPHPLPPSSPFSFKYYQFSSVTQSCPTLCDPIDCSMPGFPVLHYLPESTKTHVHWVVDAIQPSHPLLSPSPPTFNFSQHQGLFQWAGFSHQVVKVLELQLQHKSFQWIFRVDLSLPLFQCNILPQIPTMRF